MELDPALKAILKTVTDHLVAQGGPAMSGHNCVYRGESGSKCAVGCLIPDELYDPVIENLGVGAFLGSMGALPAEAMDAGQAVGAHLKSLAPEASSFGGLVSLLRALQLFHDSAAYAACKTPDDVRERLHYEGFTV